MIVSAENSVAPLWHHYGYTFRNDAIIRAGCTPQNPENLPLGWGLVAEHEGSGTGVLYCETTDDSRKLYLRGP